MSLSTISISWVSFIDYQFLMGEIYQPSVYLFEKEFSPLPAYATCHTSAKITLLSLQVKRHNPCHGAIRSFMLAESTIILFHLIISSLCLTFACAWINQQTWMNTYGLSFYRFTVDNKIKQNETKVVKADAKSDLFHPATKNNLSQTVNISQVSKHW